MFFVRGTYTNDVHGRKLIQKIILNRPEFEIAPEIDDYVYQYDGDEMGVSEEEVDLLLDYDANSPNEQYNPLRKITKEQALQDVEHLFKMLKYSYACYGYFCGDETFNKAKFNIIDYISNIKIDELTSEELEEIILKKLNFIQDGHFKINDKLLYDKKIYYYNNEIEFHRDYKGYFAVLNDRKYYIKSIYDNDEFKEYLKLSINENGDLVYHVGYLQSFKEPKYLDLKVNLLDETSNEIVVRHIELKKPTYYEYESNNKFDVKTIHNIPVISLRSMREEDRKREGIMFPETANIIEEHPVNIIDIRGNPGGNDNMSIEWFYNFTGQEPKDTNTSAFLYSRVNNYIAEKEFKKFEKDLLEIKSNNIELYNELIKNEDVQGEIKEVTERTKSKTNEWEVYYGSNEKIKNDNLNFVLVDDRTASSGETFIDYLHNLDNVVFIGTNTFGASLCNTYDGRRLYNSKIRFSFGDFISLYDEKTFKEGEGFSPDIWIGDDTTLEKTLMFIKRYNLDEI